MPAYTLTAARSGLVAISAAVIMSAAWCALIQGAPLSYMVDVFCAMPTKPLWWVTTMTGWLGLFVWTYITAGARTNQRQPRWRRIGIWFASSMMIAFAMAALTQVTHEAASVALHGMRFPSNWHSFLHLLEAAVIATVIVRLALPLIPHFDKMTPRNM